jgi:predicted dehydrogenase
MREDIKTAIIGVGPWGRNIARELDGVSSLVGFVSRKTSQQEFNAACGLNLARLTMDQVLGDPAIAAVAIATSIPLLAGLAQAALEAGKHVFVEKPLAQTAAQAQSVADTAVSRGLILITGYVFLFHPVCSELRRRVDPSHVRGVTFRWDKYGTFAEPIEQTLLTHHLALALHLFGTPRSGAVRKGAGAKTQCDSIEARLNYGDFEAISLIDRTAPQKRHDVEIEMSDGSRLIWDDMYLYRVPEDGGLREIIYQAEQAPLGIEISSFVAVASGEQRVLPSAGDFAARVLAVGEMLKPLR